MGYDAERFAEAEKNLLEALPVFQELYGGMHNETLGCVQSLVELYTKWHAAEPGKGYDAKAVQWQESLDRASVKEEQP